MEGRAPLDVHILTLFPEIFASSLPISVLGRALERGLWRYELVDIREQATDRHRTCDDTPYGGGAGMVMKADPVVATIEAVMKRRAEAGLPPAVRVALTPAGEVMSQGLAAELAKAGALMFVCGRYEGFDERVMGWIDREVSVGDFVLTGGEPAALAIIDAVVRLVPGVLGNATSAEEESFASGLLEYPQYTRPAVFRGRPVPEVLVSGDHGRIARWRHGMALLRTVERRPDLLAGLQWDDERLRLLDEARAWRRLHDGDEGVVSPVEEGE